MHDRERGAAARRRRHAVAREDLHVLRDHFRVIHVRLGERDARDQAVNLVLRDAGVREHEFRRFHVKLSGAQMRHHADFSIRRADDRDFVFEAFRGHFPDQFSGKPKTRATLSCTILRVSAAGISAKLLATFLRE